MKLRVLGQYGNGLVQCEAVLGEQIQDQIGRLKWSLWHGQVDKALGKIDDLESSIEPFSETYARFPKLVKALSELRTYIVNNRHLIPNYGERYRNGEPIATGFVESTVNEVVSKRFHIPSDLVVNQWASDVESSSHRDFLGLHSVWTTCGRLIRDKITSAISMA